MKAKSSGAHAIRILAPEGYKQKEATATRFCLLAGLACYAMSRTVVVAPSGPRRTRKVTPLARREVYLVESRSDPPHWHLPAQRSGWSGLVLRQTV